MKKWSFDSNIILHIWLLISANANRMLQLQHVHICLRAMGLNLLTICVFAIRAVCGWQNRYYTKDESWSYCCSFVWKSVHDVRVRLPRLLFGLLSEKSDRNCKFCFHSSNKFIKRNNWVNLQIVTGHWIGHRQDSMSASYQTILVCLKVSLTVFARKLSKFAKMRQ